MKFLIKYFKLEENKTNINTEIIAGITIFLSMSYILIVNPIILSESGMDKEALFTTTALTAAFATLLMGLIANLPIALAPGMGINAFFTYTVILTLGYSWQEALFAIFISGLLFLLISISGLRTKIINMIPDDIKNAVSVGIGFFIAFIGLQSVGIIINNDSTLVSIGDFTSPITLLSIFGFFLTLFFIVKKVKVPIFLGMIIITIVGIIIQLLGINLDISFPKTLVSFPPSIQPLFMQLFNVDILALLLDFNFWIIIFSFLFVDFFDTTGMLLAITKKANLYDDNGEIKNNKKALVIDSLGTIFGSFCGTSSVTSFAESLSGVVAGGKTGLTVLVTSLLFIVAMFFSPILSIITPAVTAPSLIIIGIFMVEHLKDIKFKTFESTASVFMTIIMMITTYSISEGISFGFITYTVCMIASGKRKEINPLMYGLTLLFLIHYFI